MNSQDKGQSVEKRKRTNIKLAAYYFTLLIFFQAIGIFFVLKLLKNYLVGAIILAVFIASILPGLLGYLLIETFKKEEESGQKEGQT